MPIFWREQMSVMNDRIDQDHRYLLCLINIVGFTLNSDEDRETLITALDQLHFYTRDHFIREEKLMLKISYPKYQDHKLTHEQLISQLNEIREHVINAKDNPGDDDVKSELSGLLRGWLLDHVLKDDMLMKSYLEKYPKNFT